MAQRISRAKQSIKASGVPFRLPTEQERAQRLRAVLHVLYLIFNEGYTSSAGPNLQRTRAVRRGDPADAGRSPPAAGRCRSRRTAGAHAADRCAARGAHRTGRRVDPAHQTGPDAVGSRADRRGHRAPHRHASERLGRRVPDSGRHRRRARRSGPRRGYRLAADPGAVRPAEAHVRQSDGDAQSRDRRGHGARARTRDSSC